MYRVEAAELEKFADIFGGVLRVFLDTWRSDHKTNSQVAIDTSQVATSQTVIDDRQYVTIDSPLMIAVVKKLRDSKPLTESEAKYLCADLHIVHFDARDLESASKAGDLRYIRWLKIAPTYEAFYLAAENGHVELVRWILQKAPHYRVHPNETLHYEHDSIQLAKLLGLPLDICQAAQQKAINIVDYMLPNATATQIEICLTAAIHAGDLRMIKLIRKRNAKFGIDELKVAVHRSWIDIIEYILSDSNNETLEVHKINPNLIVDMLTQPAFWFIDDDEYKIILWDRLSSYDAFVYMLDRFPKVRFGKTEWATIVQDGCVQLAELIYRRQPDICEVDGAILRYAIRNGLQMYKFVSSLDTIEEDHQTSLRLNQAAFCSGDPEVLQFRFSGLDFKTAICALDTTKCVCQIGMVCGASHYCCRVDDGKFKSSYGTLRWLIETNECCAAHIRKYVTLDCDEAKILCAKGPVDELKWLLSNIVVYPKTIYTGMERSIRAGRLDMLNVLWVWLHKHHPIGIKKTRDIVMTSDVKRAIYNKPSRHVLRWITTNIYNGDATQLKKFYRNYPGMYRF